MVVMEGGCCLVEQGCCCLMVVPGCSWVGLVRAGGWHQFAAAVVIGWDCCLVGRGCRCLVVVQGWSCCCVLGCFLVAVQDLSCCWVLGCLVVLDWRVQVQGCCLAVCCCRALGCVQESGLHCPH
jgi:hypothetical protein